jgi:hypothetical protein
MGQLEAARSAYQESLGLVQRLRGVLAHDAALDNMGPYLQAQLQQLASQQAGPVPWESGKFRKCWKRVE